MPDAVTAAASEPSAPAAEKPAFHDPLAPRREEALRVFDEYVSEDFSKYYDQEQIAIFRRWFAVGYAWGAATAERERDLAEWF